MPEIRFEDGEGNENTLADFRGRTVLLNVWATWCVPCREEMPTLDRLQAELGGPGFEVVALSIDRAGPDAVREFYSEIGIENLALHIDPSARAMFALGVVGLPTTILIDREGNELGRLVGPAEWDSPEMTEFMRSTIDQD
jgi:thiol-disulfide isomerase/thioredoxin